MQTEIHEQKEKKNTQTHMLQFSSWISRVYSRSVLWISNA